MKKIVSIFLAVLMLCASVAAYADWSKDGWWYDFGDPEGTYHFDDDELSDLRLEIAEQLNKAVGMAAIYELAVKLQENDMALMSYEITAQKSANFVYYIQAINRDGMVWSSYYFTFTHDGAQKVVSNLLNGKTKYYGIFMTDYVSGQKIKDYGADQMITGFDLTTDQAIDQFINVLNNYDYYYRIYYGDDNYDPEWDDDWDQWGNG